MPSRAVDALPTYERVIFRPDHIELALVQVKFPPLARFEEQGYLTNFSDAMSAEYPLPVVERAVGVIVTPQGVSQGPEGPKVYRFSTLDKRWSATLTADAIALESRNAYTEINEFAARLSGILDKVRDTLRPRHQLRFGLRYVNELRHPKGNTHEGWSSLGLNPDLLGFGARAAFGGTIQQTVSEIRTKRADDESFVLRHGFLEGTTVPPAPGNRPKTGPFYLLDFDYFNETASDFDPRPIDRLILYNEFLYKMFRWCVGSGELFHQLKAD